MRKLYCLIPHTLLLIWFFLDMTGLYIKENCLVTMSYKEDGIFFFIYLVTLIMFFSKEKVGKWLVLGWLSIWFIDQIMAHEWYTLFDSGFMGTSEEKIRYFSDTIKWIQVDGKYVPDVYHIILHLLILVALISTVVYIIKSKEK